MKNLLATAILASSAAAQSYTYGGNVVASSVAKGNIIYSISYTTKSDYSFSVAHTFEFLSTGKFTGTKGEVAEMMSCFFASECTVHRVTPDADLNDYILDTEVYEEPTAVPKPYTGWYTNQNDRFSTLAVANTWTITYASVTKGATQTTLKNRSYEETPVDILNIAPEKWRADYIYRIPKVAWDAATADGTLSTIQSSVEGNVNGFVAQAATVYAGTYYLSSATGTAVGAHGALALSQSASAMSIISSVAFAIASISALSF
mmetsp:Transcript_550/g.696  ORF Transcript_550/g.696 Transcript_550/m.696 type:complete len:261 (+) Transcript_550:29-811(+)|eukprot:CAMPEP_0185577784 /NCGR_PEP_ID=MMETSP0434-20130131/11009_1 /TAXON_ID=626734 ORGANISM="Favella taraikaensis, Strain Fe Narragansett Bay" /NCGR_SAMPLE_ID=MMETSP0434 /ASSEMBLY_ACC=CAM_ASM_000379 /LENGTH=260 /DNA_ID=CAMNT_0028195441 /DNA_START=28 /DNA_END=810 /DNA_ORIENTATION=+